MDVLIVGVRGDEQHQLIGVCVAHRLVERDIATIPEVVGGGLRPRLGHGRGAGDDQGQRQTTDHRRSEQLRAGRLAMPITGVGRPPCR